MIKSTLFMALFSLISFTLFAADESLPVAIVQVAKGTVLLDGKAVKLGDTINKPGMLETKDKSVVQLKIAKWNNTITLGPLSSMMLNFTEDKKYTLDKGSCRWKTSANEAANVAGGKGKIFTRHVSMGVRGTDFLLKTNALLGESEVIMFDGEVKMDNLEDPENSVIVKKGQWGGLGGRYGKKIAPPLDLPAAVVELAAKAIVVE